MTRSLFAPVVALAALTAGALALPTAASAGGCPTCQVAQNVGLIQLGMGAATLGVMAAGAAVAHNGPYYGGGCYIVRRQAVDEFGDLYVRRIRVCE